MGRLTLNVLFPLPSSNGNSHRNACRTRSQHPVARESGPAVVCRSAMTPRRRSRYQRERGEGRPLHLQTLPRALETIKLLEDDLRAKNINSQGRVDSKKQFPGGVPWTFGPLAYLLRNGFTSARLVTKENGFRVSTKPLLASQSSARSSSVCTLTVSAESSAAPIAVPSSPVSCSTIAATG